MSEIRSVHAWGFFDGNGNPRTPSGIAPSDLTPFEHYERLVRHLDHFGAEIVQQATARTLDGWLVGVEFETDARDGAGAMLHAVTQPREMWPDFATEPQPTTTEEASHG